MQGYTRTLLAISLVALTCSLTGMTQKEPAGRNSVTWTPMGPTGGDVLAMAAYPTITADHTIYAAGDGGLFISQDGARSWQPRSRGLQGHFLRTLAIAATATPTLLFVTTADGLIYLSHDAGQSWRQARAGLPDHPRVSALAPSPVYATDTTLFAGAADGAIYRSTDGAAGWLRVRGALPGQPSITSIAVSPAYARDRTVFAATTTDLLVSRDGGTTWNVLRTSPAGPARADAVAPDFNSVVLSPSFAKDHTVYAGGTTLIVSHNGGATWQNLGVVDLGYNVESVALSPAFASDGLMLAIGGTGVGGLGNAYISRTRGASWSLLAGPLSETGVYSLIFSPAYSTDHTLYAGMAGTGIEVSRNGGVTWSTANQGYNGEVIESLALSPSFDTDRTIYMATQGEGIFISRTGGNHWSPAGGQVNTSYFFNSVALSPYFASDHQVYAGARGAYLQSADEGQTWDRTYANLNGQNVNLVLAAPTYGSDHTIVAGGSIVSLTGGLHATLFASHDGGRGWLEQDTGIAGDIVKAIAYSPAYASDHTIFAGSGPYQVGGAWGRIYVTHDAGVTWHALGSAFTNLDVLSLAVTPTYPADVTIFAGTSKGLFVSHDAGLTWRAVHSLLPPGEPIDALALSPDYPTDHTLFAGGPDGLYESADGATAWRSIGDALSNSSVVTLALSPHYARDHVLVAGTANGVWKTVIGGTGALTPAPTSVVRLGQ